MTWEPKNKTDDDDDDAGSSDCEDKDKDDMLMGDEKLKDIRKGKEHVYVTELQQLQMYLCTGVMRNRSERLLPS